jgi:predicted transcriptional regulator
MQSIKTFEPGVEASGILKGIIGEEHYVLLDFGTYQIRVHSDKIKAIRGRLDNEIGNRISVLRTDLVDEPVLMIKL